MLRMLLAKTKNVKLISSPDKFGAFLFSDNLYCTMKKIFCSMLLMTGFVFTDFAQQPPGTEIYLLDLKIKKSNIQVANPQNITNHIGYDNQPYFHPDKPLIYYSSTNAEGKTDIIEYNYITKATRNITTTSEREYSPTVTPDKNFLSCIIQRDNGTQDLGKYPIEGGEPIVLINTLTTGYHAWITPESLLLFVLGDTLTLHRYDLASGKDIILAKNIGRSLHKIPKTSSMSFVHKVSAEEWLIKKINENVTVETITPTLPVREDLAWTPDGKILMSDGKKLFFYEPGKSSSWQEIEMPSTMPAGLVTRLAVNLNGNMLAIVVAE
jgi:WD40-like Beta Propeller Repeat